MAARLSCKTEAQGWEGMKMEMLRKAARPKSPEPPNGQAIGLRCRDGAEADEAGNWYLRLDGWVGG